MKIKLEHALRNVIVLALFSGSAFAAEPPAADAGKLLVNARWLIPAVLFGAAAFFSALTIPYFQKQLTK